MPKKPKPIASDNKMTDAANAVFGRNNSLSMLYEPGHGEITVVHEGHKKHDKKEIRLEYHFFRAMQSNTPQPAAATFCFRNLNSENFLMLQGMLRKAKVQIDTSDLETRTIHVVGLKNHAELKILQTLHDTLETDLAP